MRAISRDWSLHLFGLCIVGGMGVIAFLRDTDVPGVVALDLGTHELGHMVASAAALPEVVDAMMGPLVQVGVPVIATLMLLLVRRDLLLAGLAAGWAAVSLADTARYIADAPTGRLERLGGEQDWTFLLGSEQFDLMSRSSEIAELARAAGVVAFAASVTLITGGLVLATGAERRLRLLRSVPVKPLDWSPPAGFRPPSGRRVHAR